MLKKWIDPFWKTHKRAVRRSVRFIEKKSNHFFPETDIRILILMALTWLSLFVFYTSFFIWGSRFKHSFDPVLIPNLFTEYLPILKPMIDFWAI